MFSPREGQPARFALEDWGGRRWHLDLDRPMPGLIGVDPQIGPLLALEGLATAGRSQTRLFHEESLVEQDSRSDRVQATYAPAGWGELSVRATWSRSPAGAIDLEVQVAARSVGELSAVEVWVRSDWPGASLEGSGLRVEPRDARAATLSYDGREAEPGVIETGATRDLTQRWGQLAPRRSRWADGAPLDYLEMALSADVARRIEPMGPRGSKSVRYALFGHDLERGVVLRGRLRALWIPSDSDEDAVARACDAFTAEPPPLGP